MGKNRTEEFTERFIKTELEKIIGGKMGLLDFLKSETEKKKEKLLDTIPSKVLKKIAEMKGYDKSEAYEEIKEKMNVSEIKRYIKVATAQLGKEKLRVSERNLRQVIEAWKPPKLQSEKAFENHLKDRLYEKFGREEVRTQAGEFNADIVVGNTFPIELKYNFDYQDSNRIISQIEKYWREYKARIFLVVCGIKRDNGWTDYKKIHYPKYKKKIIEIVKFKEEL